VNAANQIHTLTRVLRRAILDASEHGRLARMPRITVFQSVVDSTVTAPEVVRGLLNLLPAGGHELVVFDANRREELEGLVDARFELGLARLRAAPSLPFRLTIVGNRSDGSNAVALFTREAGSPVAAGETGTAAAVREEPLPLAWPRGVISLGHVALPFPPDDPVYGLDPPAEASPRFQLGAVPVRGEGGALVVPLDTFARLRCNPFFSVIREKIVSSLTAEGAEARTR
jgi:hypothetical protein